MRSIHAIYFFKDVRNNISLLDQVKNYKELIEQQKYDIMHIIYQLINAITDQFTSIIICSGKQQDRQQIEIIIDNLCFNILNIKNTHFCKYQFSGCKIHYFGYIQNCDVGIQSNNQNCLQIHSIEFRHCDVQTFQFVDSDSLKDVIIVNTKFQDLILPKYIKNININNQLNDGVQQRQNIDKMIFTGYTTIITIKVSSTFIFETPCMKNNDITLINLSHCTNLREIVLENIKQNIKLPEHCLQYLELSQDILYENKIINEVINSRSININGFDLQNLKIISFTKIKLNQCKLTFVTIISAQYIKFITNSYINTVKIKSHDDCYDLSSNYVENLILPNFNFKTLKIKQCIQIDVKKQLKNQQSQIRQIQKARSNMNSRKLLLEERLKQNNIELKSRYMQVSNECQLTCQNIITKMEIIDYLVFDFSLLTNLQKIELTKLFSNIVFPIQIEEIHISNGDAYVNNFDFQHLTNIRKICISECCIDTINFSNIKFHFDLNKNTSFIIKTDKVVDNGIEFDFIQDVQELTLSYLSSFDLSSQQDSIIRKFSEILDFSVFTSLQTLSLHSVNKKINTPQSLVKFDLNNENINFENQLVQNFDFSQHNKLKTVSIQYTKIKNLITQISPCISFCVIAYSKIKNLENIYYTHINCHETIDSYEETENWWQKAHDNHMREYEIWKQGCQKLGHEPSEEHFEFECYKDEYINKLMRNERFIDCTVGIIDLSNVKNHVNMKLCISYYQQFTKLLRLKEVNKQTIFSIKHKKLISNLRLEIVLALKIQYLQSQIQKLVYQ